MVTGSAPSIFLSVVFQVSQKALLGKAQLITIRPICLSSGSNTFLQRTSVTNNSSSMLSEPLQLNSACSNVMKRRMTATTVILSTTALPTWPLKPSFPTSPPLGGAQPNRAIRVTIPVSLTVATNNATRTVRNRMTSMSMTVTASYLTTFSAILSLLTVLETRSPPSSTEIARGTHISRHLRFPSRQVQRRRHLLITTLPFSLSTPWRALPVPLARTYKQALQFLLRQRLRASSRENLLCPTTSSTAGRSITTIVMYASCNSARVVRILLHQAMAMSR